MGTTVQIGNGVTVTKRMISVREEQPGDVAAIRDLNIRAFSGSTEADIVDRLRNRCPDLLSLVAVDNRCIVGHILFSPVTIKTKRGTIVGVGLAPMAVLPEHQHLGIGSKLVRYGLRLLKRRNCPFVIVLGHPEYYPRFGFVPASQYGLECQWENVPDEAFMVKVIDREFMTGISGVVKYGEEFTESV